MSGVEVRGVPSFSGLWRPLTGRVGLSGRGMLKVGDTLGRFRIQRVLGRGSHGAVFAAVDALLGEPVAIKVLQPLRAGDPRLVERFKRELVLTRRVTHPSICRLYDLHEDADQLYLSMQLVEGESLATLLRRRALRPLEVINLLRSLCDALDAAHQQGVVHRDLKPANIMVGEYDGRVVILDFGIATASSGVGQLTRPGEALGSVPFIPPEVWNNLPATELGDQYATGVTGFAALTRQLPYSGATPLEVFDAIKGPRPSLRHHLPDVDDELEATILRAIAVDPAKRFPTMRAFDTALGAIQSRLRSVFGAPTVTTSTLPSAAANPSAFPSADPDQSATEAVSTSTIPEPVSGVVALSPFVVPPQTAPESRGLDLNTALEDDDNDDPLSVDSSAVIPLDDLSEHAVPLDDDSALTPAERQASPDLSLVSSPAGNHAGSHAGSHAPSIDDPSLKSADVDEFNEKTLQIAEEPVETTLETAGAKPPADVGDDGGFGAIPATAIVVERQREPPELTARRRGLFIAIGCLGLILVVLTLALCDERDAERDTKQVVDDNDEGLPSTSSTSSTSSPSSTEGAPAAELGGVDGVDSVGDVGDAAVDDIGGANHLDVDGDDGGADSNAMHDGDEDLDAIEDDASDDGGPATVGDTGSHPRPATSKPSRSRGRSEVAILARAAATKGVRRGDAPAFDEALARARHALKVRDMATYGRAVADGQASLKAINVDRPFVLAKVARFNARFATLNDNAVREKLRPIARDVAGLVTKKDWRAANRQLNRGLAIADTAR